MTTTNDPKRHPFLAASILGATLMTCISLTAAPIAIAEPNTDGWDENGFNACVAQIPAGDTDYKYHYFLCCQQNGGTPTDRPDLKGCAIPTSNGPAQQQETMNPPAPPPGATAILHPGLNTRAGTQ
jgi:hypothetical protein